MIQFQTARWNFKSFNYKSDGHYYFHVDLNVIYFQGKLYVYLYICIYNVCIYKYILIIKQRTRFRDSVLFSSHYSTKCGQNISLLGQHLTILCISFAHCRYFSDARKFLKPNTQMILLYLIITQVISESFML